ncbi:hypothetical protein KDK95_05370 [Actinospica sp. MGRD01-02]|uniref:MFS transporter n=1 Tax=Actinospica acidithermotolerans TaxID=2828514 RepID=A0A941EAZ5_9ACTN|nr:MFS transporter [Actinospica acidithermotolerans]MBR7825729.1 hypothetical protein [Actinospica acidithermotolerans]
MPQLTAALRARPPAGAGPLVCATGLLAIGKGVFLSTLVVYLLTIVHVGSFAASSGAAAWGLAAVVAAVPAGLAMDRFPPRVVGAAASLGAVPMLAIAGSVHRLEYLLPAVFLGGGLDAVGGVARRTLLAARAGDGVAALAWARSASNAGFAIGAVLCVPLLGSHSPGTYRTAYVLAALSYAAVTVALLWAPARKSAAEETAEAVTQAAEQSAETAAPAPRRVETAAALATSTAILGLHASLLDVAFPLCIATRTSVPVSAFGWLLLINTLITIFGQIAASRWAQTVEGALRCTMRSALWTAACCVLLGLVALGPTPWQVATLVAAMLALTAGEMLQSAGEWGLSALLAEDHEHGFYQGACVFGESVQSSGGPLLVGAVLGAAPVVGWGVLGALLLSGHEVTRRLGRSLRPAP